MLILRMVQTVPRQILERGASVTGKDSVAMLNSAAVGSVPIRPATSVMKDRLLP